MMKMTACVIGLLVASAPHIACAQVSIADARLPAAVDSIAGGILSQTGVPSASVAVVTHGKVAYAKAYGAATLEPRAPATPDMRYAIGSISKQFTAASVLLLQQEHKLSLDDPVGKYVPGLTHGDVVTIRELLSHTSGYQDYWPQDYVPPEMTRPIDPDSIITRWAKRPLDFPPGSRWQYSNTNFVIAARIVERVSGMPEFQFVQRRILTPLALTSAVDFDRGGTASVQPAGYLRFALGPLRPAPEEGAGWAYGAFMLAMTASDLARWDIAMIDGALLSPASWRLLESDVPLSSGVATGYGLGVDVGTYGGHRMISHGGETSGFVAENMVFPDDSAAVVVLTNQDASPAAGAIADAVARVLFTTEDTLAASRTAQARRIFEGLQHGTIDRSLFSPNANAYFSDQALRDFATSLGPLGAPSDFAQVRQALRGGMTLRSYRVTFPNGRAVRAWTFELPDGKLEQYQVAPIG